MFRTKVVEKVKTDILCSVNFFPKIMPCMWCGKIWYSQTGHGWWYNTGHALGMLDNLGYRQTDTVWICNIYCFSTATTVMRMLLGITLRACCLSPHCHMARQSTIYLSLDFLFRSPTSPFLLPFSFVFFPFFRTPSLLAPLLIPISCLWLHTPMLFPSQWPW